MVSQLNDSLVPPNQQVIDSFDNISASLAHTNRDTSLKFHRKYGCDNPVNYLSMDFLENELLTNLEKKYKVI